MKSFCLALNGSFSRSSILFLNYLKTAFNSDLSEAISVQSIISSNSVKIQFINAYRALSMKTEFRLQIENER